MFIFFLAFFIEFVCFLFFDFFLLFSFFNPELSQRFVWLCYSSQVEGLIHGQENVPWRKSLLPSKSFKAKQDLTILYTIVSFLEAQQISRTLQELVFYSYICLEDFLIFLQQFDDHIMQIKKTDKKVELSRDSSSSGTN